MSNYNNFEIKPAKLRCLFCKTKDNTNAPPILCPYKKRGRFESVYLIKVKMSECNS
jgi:hypothetical protein